MTKKIYINGRFLTQSITGVQRYAMELVKSIDELLGSDDPAVKGCEFVVLAPRGKLQETHLKHIKVRQIGPLSGHLWEQLILPLHTAGGFLVNLCNTAPMFKRNQAVTMHDAAVYAVPETYSLAFKVWYRLLFRVLGTTAKQILTCSEFSKQQLMHYFKIKEAKIRTIYHGKEHLLHTPSATAFIQEKQLNRPFVLAVSSMSPNKNFRSIVEAIGLIGDADFDIVIAGGTNKIFKQAEGGFGSGVKHLGYVKDEELRALYDHAACFVFPSFYEGFGLPPLEAMACGCPVIVSKAASLPEVCGGAALYCDPHRPQDIADQIQRLMQHPDLRDLLSRRGLERSKSFSWSKCARETMAVIRSRMDAPAFMPDSEKGLIQ